MTPIQQKSYILQALHYNLGLPIGFETPLLNGSAFLAYSSGITIYHHPDVGTFEVHGAILGFYILQGGPLGGLGYPITDEIDWREGDGKKSVFQNGIIAWNPQKGSRILQSDGLAIYLQKAAENAFMMLTLPFSESKSLIIREEYVQINPKTGIIFDWCGYTVENFYRKAGFDLNHFPLFESTQGLLSYGSYYTRDIYENEFPSKSKTKIEENGVWEDLKEYHKSRGALRGILLYDKLQAGTPLDILPGDIVLVDGKKGSASGPDHIQIVYKWDELTRVLIVIDGNGLSFAQEETLKKHFSVENLILGTHYSEAGSTPEINNLTKLEKQQILDNLVGQKFLIPNYGDRLGISCHVLKSDKQKNPARPTDTSPHHRVYAIIRSSIVDFESHSYQHI